VIERAGKFETRWPRHIGRSNGAASNSRSILRLSQRAGAEISISRLTLPLAYREKCQNFPAGSPYPPPRKPR
jgi:hypothetical protein